MKNKFLKTETAVVKALSEKVNKIHQKNSKNWFFLIFVVSDRQKWRQNDILQKLGNLAFAFILGAQMRRFSIKYSVRCQKLFGDCVIL